MFHFLLCTRVAYPQSNGNGLVLYDIPRRADGEDLFTVDWKEGVVTTSARLDFETQAVHNVTLVARDLGSPSLSATALLVVGVVDVPETLEDTLGPMFLHRYYEVRRRHGRGSQWRSSSGPLR